MRTPRHYYLQVMTLMAEDEPEKVAEDLAQVFELTMIFWPSRFGFPDIFPEKLVVRADTKQVLDMFIEDQGLRAHPRLRRFKITGPDGVIENIKGRR